MHFGAFPLTTEAIDQPQADLKRAPLRIRHSGQRFVTLHKVRRASIGRVSARASGLCNRALRLKRAR